MPDQRPAIPADLERRVLIEAGHRCAVPTCKQTPVELAHIIPWSQVKMHKFDNLIALCPTCHTRYDNGDIDRKCMLSYKNQLGGINVQNELLQRVARLEQEANIQAGEPPQGFATAVALYHNRTCLIGIIDGPKFVTVGSCTFVRPRVAIVPGAVLELIADILKFRGDYPAVWEPAGMSKFCEIRAPREDGDLRLIQLGPPPDYDSELLQKYGEKKAGFMRAAFRTNESSLRTNLGIYQGDHVGFLTAAENTNELRGSMEFQFQDAYVSFKGKSQEVGAHTGYLTPVPCSINHEGAPVFRSDGTLLALLTGVIFVQGEQGGRPVFTTLLSLPELWRSNVEPQH